MDYEKLKGIVDFNAIAVDAGCSGNPGPMEYQGVYLGNEQRLFHYGPVHGTNNIGEFLAIVHALALIKQKGWDMKVYSDSYNAILPQMQDQVGTYARDGRSLSADSTSRGLALEESAACSGAEVGNCSMG